MISRWQEKLQRMPTPTSLVTWLNVWLLLLLLLLLANNYVFLPGFEEMPNLPVAENAKIMRADKLIVTVTKEWYVVDTHKAQSFQEIESALDTKLHEIADTEVSLVVRADREVPYDRLVDIFSYAQKQREKDVHVFLATEPKAESKLGVE